MVRHRHWDRDVYTNHSNLYVLAVLTCCIAITCEDRCAICVAMAMYEVQSFFIGVLANNGQDWPKDLFFPNGHVWRDIVEQCATYEVAVFIALFGLLETAPVNDKVCACCFPFINIG